MCHSKLAEHLNELGEASGGDEVLVDIASNDAEPVMRRVAAILIAVNLSVPVGHALAAAATQTIYDLTVADKDRYHGDPWDTAHGPVPQAADDADTRADPRIRR